MTTATPAQRLVIGRYASMLVAPGTPSAIPGVRPPPRRYPVEGEHHPPRRIDAFNATAAVTAAAVAYLTLSSLFMGRMMVEMPTAIPTQIMASSVLWVLVTQAVLQLLLDGVRPWLQQVPPWSVLLHHALTVARAMFERARRWLRTDTGHGDPGNSSGGAFRPDAKSRVARETVLSMVREQLGTVRFPDETDDGRFAVVAEEVQEQIIEEEFFENERFQPFRGFGSTYPGHLLPTDRNHWSDRYGSMLATAPTLGREVEFFHVAPRAPRGWVFLDDWQVDVSGTHERRVDPDGWSYAFDFIFLEFPPAVSSDKPGTGTFVRRRRWVRHRVPTINRHSFTESPLQTTTPRLAVATAAPPDTAPTEGAVAEARVLPPSSPAKPEQHRWIEPGGRDAMGVNSPRTATPRTRASERRTAHAVRRVDHTSASSASSRSVIPAPHEATGTGGDPPPPQHHPPEARRLTPLERKKMVRASPIYPLDNPM